MPADSLLRKVPRWSFLLTSERKRDIRKHMRDAKRRERQPVYLDCLTSDLEDAPLFFLASAAVPLAGDSVNFDLISICGLTVVSLMTRLVAAAVSSVSSPRRNDIFSRTLHLLQ